MSLSAADLSPVGVVGLGAMGTPMARHLLAAHGTLAFYARRPQPDLVAAGATRYSTPRELASQIDVLLVMLPDLPQLQELLEGPDGMLTGLCDENSGDDGSGNEHELLLLIGSTSSPPAVRELGADLAARTGGRVHVVDCPVSGGEDGAIAGTLSIMLGGEPDDVSRAAAVLAPCGTCVHLGPLGAGEVAKACNQLVVAATILALGEATVLAERSGLDLDAFWTLLSGGYAGSNLLASRRQKLVTGDDSPSGVAKYLVKDLRFVADVAATTRTDPALLPALRAAFDEIVARGLGDRDMAVTRRYVAERGPEPQHGQNTA
jgi:3-hydroxyisobutyrate dehydrogenase-like beta-hydroxyacid dehydrogenase